MFGLSLRSRTEQIRCFGVLERMQHKPNLNPLSNTLVLCRGQFPLKWHGVCIRAYKYFRVIFTQFFRVSPRLLAIAAQSKISSLSIPSPLAILHAVSSLICLRFLIIAITSRLTPIAEAALLSLPNFAFSSSMYVISFFMVFHPFFFVILL